MEQVEPTDDGLAFRVGEAGDPTRVTVFPGTLSEEMSMTYRARDVTTEWLCVDVDELVSLDEVR